LINLGLDAIDVVNLRMGGGSDGHSAADDSLAEQFEELALLQQEGLIKHLGVSTVSAEQIAEAQAIAPVVCVQNHYNVAHRGDDDIIDSLAAQGIAYVPYFPLGGFSPLQSDTLNSVAARIGATPHAVAQAWLLQRSPNILVISGTSSLAHLCENVAAADLKLSDADVAELDSITS
jgi:aryl-alcohol dehydrogenase-like predicted oxidoreductase